ncbi:unnamed protein product [Urochloa humidicola]
MKEGAGVGLVFVSPLGVRMRYSVRLHFTATNNVAEYEALVKGLRIAAELDIRRLDIRGDAKLVVDQVMKESDCRNDMMAAYSEEVRKLEEKFDGLELRHIPSCQNEAADQLAKLASSREPVTSGIFVNDQHESSVQPPKRKRGSEEEGNSPKRAKGGDGSVAPGSGASSGAGPGAGSKTAPTADPMADRGTDSGADHGAQDKVDQDPETHPTPHRSDCRQVMELEPSAGRAPDLPADWRTPLLDCLVKGKIPDDQTEARRIARRAKTFYVVDGRLFKKSTTGIDQKCILPDQGTELLRDIHAGACGHHAAPRSLVGNAFRQGFYWPTAVADATAIVRSCEGCQFYVRQTHLPAQAL